MERGIITSIDRDNRLVKAVLLDHLGSEIEAAYPGEPPWPLSTAWFEGGPQWFCVCPIGDRRVLVRDDFMWVDTAGVILSGDTPWQFNVTGTGGITDLDEPGGGAAGAVDLSTAGTDQARFRKLNRAVNLQDDDLGLWFSARVKMNSNLQNATGGALSVGLGNQNVYNPSGLAATDVGLYFSFDTVTGMRANSHEGTTILATTTGEDVGNGSWFWLDIVAIADEWAAFWINGSGPYVNITQIPDFGDQGFEPFVSLNGGTGTCHLYVDVIELQMAGPVNHPTAFALDPAAQWSFGL